MTESNDNEHKIPIRTFNINGRIELFGSQKLADIERNPQELNLHRFFFPLIHNGDAMTQGC